MATLFSYVRGEYCGVYCFRKFLVLVVEFEFNREFSGSFRYPKVWPIEPKLRIKKIRSLSANSTSNANAIYNFRQCKRDGSCNVDWLTRYNSQVVQIPWWYLYPFNFWSLSKYIQTFCLFEWKRFPRNDVLTFCSSCLIPLRQDVNTASVPTLLATAQRVIFDYNN